MDFVWFRFAERCSSSKGYRDPYFVILNSGCCILDTNRYLIFPYCGFGMSLKVYDSYLVDLFSRVHILVGALP